MTQSSARRDLWQRYGAVLGEAWRSRRQLDPPHRLPHEVQFLPAALALQDTPAPPAPRVAMALIVGFALIAVLWAVFGEIDMVATARGRVVHNDRSKLIQPMETATVKAILVRDGETVRAGQSLMELDATVPDADSSRFASDLVAARAQVARASALLQALERNQVPHLVAWPGASTERMAQEQRHVDAQFGQYRAKLERIEADIARREAELVSTREIVSKLEQTAPIARQRARDFRDLVDKNFVSRHGYLEKEQVRIEQEADLATQKSRLLELAAALRETRGERAELVAETRRSALDSLNEGEQRSAALGQEVIKAESRRRLMTLKAPVAGTVQQLAMHTVGGVVTPAQALMVIVPRDHALEVEAALENKDVGFVNPGQAVEVKVETFPFTRYGTLHGVVADVSADAINDEKKGLVYSARVRLERTTMVLEDRTVNLTPGMAVTAEIKTGKRRVIEYFLSPLLQYKDESLRER